jgi:hypothetical protein
LTAKAAKKARKSQNWSESEYVPWLSWTMSNVWPPLKYSARMATSNSTLPASVYRKNLIAA